MYDSDESPYEEAQPLTQLVSDSNETELIKDTMNRQIVACLEKYGITLTTLQTIFEGDYCCTNDKCRLNYAIRMLKKLEYIPIKDTILCFDSFAPMNKVLNHIDEETVAQLKFELAYEYNIELEENELYD